MFPVNMNEMVVIIIGLGIIIIPLLFRERLDTTFDLKKWLILLVLGVTIYVIHANPNNALPQLAIPILAMVGLFVMIHF